MYNLPINNILNIFFIFKNLFEQKTNSHKVNLTDNTHENNQTINIKQISDYLKTTETSQILE